MEGYDKSIIYHHSSNQFDDDLFLNGWKFFSLTVSQNVEEVRRRSIGFLRANPARAQRAVFWRPFEEVIVIPNSNGMGIEQETLTFTFVRSDMILTREQWIW